MSEARSPPQGDGGDWTGDRASEWVWTREDASDQPDRWRFLVRMNPSAP